MNDVYTEYAEALFELGQNSSQSEKYLSDLELVSEIFLSNPEYKELLSSPAVLKEEKLSLIEKAFKPYVSKDTLNFLKLLCERKRISKIEECVSAYRRIYNDSFKIAVAKVVSAVALTEKEKSAVKEKTEKLINKKVKLECSEDPSLIGGMVIRVDGKVFDGSISSKLRDIKEVIDR